MVIFNSLENKRVTPSPLSNKLSQNSCPQKVRVELISPWEDEEKTHKQFILLKYREEVFSVLRETREKSPILKRTDRVKPQPLKEKKETPYLSEQHREKHPTSSTQK